LYLLDQLIALFILEIGEVCLDRSAFIQGAPV
jgi:hypothetical protein